MQADILVRPTSSLGHYLAAARRAAGLSVRQLERLSGVHRAAISRLENNCVDQPAAESLLKLARVLELNDTDLLLRAGLPVPHSRASLEIMLRAEYGLPPAAITEAKQQLQAIIEKYDHDG